MARSCSVCKETIKAKETRSVIAIRSFKYYFNYSQDIAQPNVRRKLVFCPDCTNSYNRWLTARLEEVSSDGVTEED